MELLNVAFDPAGTVGVMVEFNRLPFYSKVNEVMHIRPAIANVLLAAVLLLATKVCRFNLSFISLSVNLYFVKLRKQIIINCLRKILFNFFI